MTYEDKVRHAITLLQSIPQDCPGGVEISYSGGKDSDVILELAKMAGIPYEAIYKNTTVDRPGTIKHCKDNGVTVLNPKMSMLQLIEKKGWPSRWSRFCCSFLKEYKVKERAVQGIRRCESTKRAKIYKEPEVCRVYNKKEKVRIYLPILEWTDEDVERFIAERGIKCHPHYYDEDGNFHVERRVGCVGCCMQTDRGKADFKKYPKLFKAEAKAYKRWFDNHPGSKSAKSFKTAYDSLYMKLFCDNMEEFNTKLAPPIFSEYQLVTKDYLEEYFGIKFEGESEKK